MTHYRRNKVRLILLKGGMCIDCEVKYDGKNACIFHFHHRDPSVKEYELRFNMYGKVKIAKEAEKCDLLCANCHEKKHSGEF